MDSNHLSKFRVYKPTSSTETTELCRIVAQCFSTTIPEEQIYVDRLGIENFRIVKQDDHILGGLQIYPMGQWYGGNVLQIAGIAAVGIAPEHRGTGAAAALMTNCLREFHHDRIPLAVLYASTQRLYRKVGFEQAGTLCRYSVPTSSLVPRHRDLPMISVEPNQWERFVDLYQQQAKTNPGNLDRHPAIWKRLIQPPKDGLYAYLIGPETNPQGYVMFEYESTESRPSIYVRDFVTLTGAAQERLWSFCADHRSIVQNIIWPGPIVNPSLLLLPEQTYQVSRLERWFIRLVDVPLALSQRGYPSIDVELHFEINDEVIPENQGRFVLTVTQGQGHVTPGGQGDLKTSVRGLAPLFSGLLTAPQLQQLGYLEGSSEALTIASLLFSGPEPWMPDHF